MVLRRRKVFRARGRQGGSGLVSSVALAMLFVTGFAYGLHRIDLRYAEQSFETWNAPAEAPAEGLVPSALEALSAVFRDYIAIPTAQAAPDYSKYFGAPEKRVYDLQAAPGQVVELTVNVKNAGTATWTNAGSRYVSAYTIKPRYHASVFRSSDWKSSSQTPRIANASVRKGETAELRLKLTAPAKAGTYSDTFQLASEDTSWIWGAFFTVRMKVSGAPAASLIPPAPPAAPPATPAASTATENAGESLKGSLSFRSAERIEAPGGIETTLRLVFRNEGDAPWKRHGLRLVSFKGPAGGDEALDDSAWPSPERPVIIDRIVARGGNADVYFTFTTPRKRGDYAIRLEFVSDGVPLASAPIDLPVKVISDAVTPPPIVETAPQPAPIVPDPAGPSTEPLIRVGLYATDKIEEIGSAGAFEARAVDGSLLASFRAGSRAQVSYDLASRVYRLKGDGVDLISVSPVRFVQAGAAKHFTVWSYENRPKWNLTLNDNTFRGVLELRKNDRNDYVWLINELPMESYLKGMAETSDVSHAEFKKALAVAARSYAWWHYTHPGKHWHFTVDATYDQVYRGYGAESRLPKWAAAVDATRGQVVTYDGAPVVTPYFTWSDGRTRAWTEVWGGSAKPWLVSVPATHDAAAGRTLFGHGVGMSAWDAIGRANAGETHDAILRYYYQGTGLVAAY